MSNTVTQQQVNDFLNKCKTQEHVFWDKELVVSYKCPNGFTVLGRAACVDPANFDLKVGRRVAKQDAEDKVWMLLGYELQQKLYDQKVALL